MRSRRERTGSTSRIFLGVAFAVACTAASAGAQSVVVADSTACALSLTARHANVDCTLVAGTVQVTLPDGSARAMVVVDGAAYTYDATGDLVAITPAPGESTAYTYDGDARLVAARTAREVATAFLYDSLGRLTRIEGANGDAVDFTYDTNGRVVVVRETPSGQATEYAYEEGERVSSVASRGEIVSFTYGREGIVRARSTGETTEYTYDERHVLASIDTQAGTTTLIRDVRANVTRIASADGRTTDYSYDRSARIVSRAGAAQVTTYIYDERGDLLTGDGGAAFSYDGDGSLIAMRDEGGDVRLTYDANERVARIARSDGRATHYTYDELGRLLQVDVPAGDETVVEFREGTPREPFVLSNLWDDGTVLDVRVDGRMIACGACP